MHHRPVSLLSPLLGTGGGPAPFAPSDLSDLALWLKADAGTNQTAGGSPATADGDPVGEWQDQSGNARHATQATAGLRPTLRLNVLNGKQAIRSDGVDDYLTSTYSPTGQISAFVVLKYITFDTLTQLPFSCHKTGTPSGGVLFGAYKATGTQNMLILQSGEGGTWVDGVNHLEVHVLPSTAHMVSLVIQATATDLWIDQVNKVADAVNGSIAVGNALRLFANGAAAGDYADADIHEIVMYSRAVNSTERGQVETYLKSAARWGI